MIGMECYGKGVRKVNIFILKETIIRIRIKEQINRQEQNQ